jgi:hypothetical protein
MDALLKYHLSTYMIVKLYLRGDLINSFNLQRMRHNSQVCSAPSWNKQAIWSINEIVDILHAIQKGDFVKTLEKYYMQLEAKKEIRLMTNTQLMPIRFSTLRV